MAETNLTITYRYTVAYASNGAELNILHGYDEGTRSDMWRAVKNSAYHEARVRQAKRVEECEEHCICTLHFCRDGKSWTELFAAVGNVISVK